MHGGRYPQIEVITKTEVTQHTYAETRIPVVHVTGDGTQGAVLQQLRSHIAHLGILQVQAHADAEVEGTQVYVGFVLNLTFLRRSCQADGDQ